MKNKEKTPLEEYEKKRLTLSYLQTWGRLAKVNVPITKKRKLGPKTVDCVFLCYAIHSVGYRFSIVKFGVPNMHVDTFMESRDAISFEDIFPMREEASTTSSDLSVNKEPTVLIEHNEHTYEENPKEDDNKALRRSKRQRTTKSFGDNFVMYLVDDTPRVTEEAYSSPDAATGRKQYKVRWILLCLMVHGK
jgi:hypothetical protein